MCTSSTDLKPEWVEPARKPEVGDLVRVPGGTEFTNLSGRDIGVVRVINGGNGDYGIEFAGFTEGHNLDGNTRRYRSGWYVRPDKVVLA